MQTNRGVSVCLFPVFVLLAIPADPALAECDGQGLATLILKGTCEAGSSVKLRLAGVPDAKYALLRDLGAGPTEISSRVFKRGDRNQMLGEVTFSYDPADPPAFPLGSVADGLVITKVVRSGLYLLVSAEVTACARGDDDPELYSDSTFETVVDDVVVSRDIHTSCSQDVGVGFRFGPIFITSIRGFIDCANGTCGDNLCDDGKPCRLTLVYTGEGCDATQHSQDPDKVQCDDDPLRSDAHVWFEGTVELGDAFDMLASNAGESRFKAKTYVHVFDLDGNLLQFLRFHTSCSQPLRLDDQFGSLLLTDFTPE